jgi:hypothetical protein
LVGVQRWYRVAEYLDVGVADGRARLDAEFLDQAGAQVAVDGEGLGLAAGAVEGEHQLAVVGLAQRILGDERRQLGHEPGQPGPAQGEFGVVTPLQQEQPRLRQALHEGVAAEVRGQSAERCAAPERQSAGAGAYDARPVPAGVRGPRLGNCGVEHVHVQLAVVDSQQVAGWYGPEPLRVVEEPAQPGDVIVQRGLRGDRRRPAPQGVLQRLDRHDPAGLQQQRGEQRAHLGAADGPDELVGGVGGVGSALGGSGGAGVEGGMAGGVVQNPVRLSVVQDGRSQQSEPQLAPPHHAAPASPRGPVRPCSAADGCPPFLAEFRPSSADFRHPPSAGRGRIPLGSGPVTVADGRLPANRSATDGRTVGHMLAIRWWVLV